MTSKKDFEERCADAMEKIAEATASISKSTKAILDSQKQLNDNFLLHQGATDRIAHDLAMENEKAALALTVANEKVAAKLAETNAAMSTSITTANERICAKLEGQGEEIKGIREDFKTTVYPIFKWLVVAVIAIAGGTAVVRLLGVA